MCPKPSNVHPWKKMTPTKALNYVLKIFCFVFVWCPSKAIDVSVQRNGGFLPGI